MFEAKTCRGRKGPIPLGDEDRGEIALRPFFMLHDYLYLDDEMHAPISETTDSAALALEELEREHERLLAQQAVVAEKVEAARVTFRNQRDAILVHGASTALEDDEALRRAFSAEVATRLRVSDRTATNMVEEAKTVINDLPGLADAWRLGWVSQQHVRAATHQAWNVPKDARRAFDDAITPKARTQTPSRFQSTARKLREKLHPESIEERKKEAFALRQAEVYEDPDGMASITLHHSADVILSIEHGMRVLAKRRKNETPGEQRTLAQLGADILAEGLLSQLGVETLRIGAFGQTPESEPTISDADTDAESDPEDAESSGAEPSDFESGGVESSERASLHSALTPAQLAAMRPGVVITVPAETLLGKGDEPAVLGGYGPIDIDTATDIISQASSFHRVLTSPVDGSTVAIDPNKYRLSEQVKRLIRTRDVTCGFPGCDVPAERCDIDHVVAWVDGGRSSPEDLVCLCRRHHTLKHSTRWHSEVQPDGSLLWTSPTGAKHVTQRGGADRA
ncbi:HNH endonuclease signature motif containing protein [Paramicrobacterium chengjingii]|uniref:HNH endonuclease signature motif containing protein n=1 Tax=Paramicrobacterium chengjingii TaxID=2769067 RepID=UPI001420B3F8|nr:HNH endonuclease signature motif containing protein [Microbacterium chengjingii]